MNDLNDDLASLFTSGAPIVPATPRALPATYVTPEQRFAEPCGKCRGTGRFTSYSGRQLGQCFACKGAGKNVFKTSAVDRAKARARSAAKATNRAQELRDAALAWQAAHPAATQWLNANCGHNSFAMSLMDGLTKFGSLTDNQLAAVERNIAKVAAVAEAQTKAAPAVDAAGVDRLKLAFDHAIAYAAAKGRGLKQPRITLGCVVISPAKADSANPGALYVKSGSTYLGKIKDGVFMASRDCTAELQAQVLAFLADPKAAAEAYGIETGVCCVCNAELTNKISIERGIGPVCAEKFGW